MVFYGKPSDLAALMMLKHNPKFKKAIAGALRNFFVERKRDISIPGFTK